MPSDIVSLLVIIGAVLPGATYTWAFERQAGAFGQTLADRTLRFTAVSVFFHVVLAWPEYALYRIWFTSHHFHAGQFAALWSLVLLLTAIPGLTGYTVGKLYATRNSRVGMKWIRHFLTEKGEERLLKIFVGNEPEPRAWDNLFCERPRVYIRVRTTSGYWLGGRFANNSYAAGNPNDTDLYLEEAFQLNPDTTFTDVSGGYSVYIPASQIEWMEIIRP